MADQGDPQAGSVTFKGFLGSSPGDDPVRLFLDPAQTQEVQIAAADVTGTAPADGGMTDVWVGSDALVRFHDSSTGAEMLEGGPESLGESGPIDFMQTAGLLARSNPPRACRP